MRSKTSNAWRACWKRIRLLLGLRVEEPEDSGTSRTKAAASRRRLRYHPAYVTRDLIWWESSPSGGSRSTSLDSPGLEGLIESSAASHMPATDQFSFYLPGSGRLEFRKDGSTSRSKESFIRPSSQRWPSTSCTRPDQRKTRCRPYFATGMESTRASQDQRRWLSSNARVRDTHYRRCARAQHYLQMALACGRDT